MKNKALLFLCVTGAVFFALLHFLFFRIFPGANQILFSLLAPVVMAIFIAAVREASFMIHSFFDSEYEKKTTLELNYPLRRSIFFWPINLFGGPLALLFFGLLGLFCLREKFIRQAKKQSINAL